MIKPGNIVQIVNPDHHWFRCLVIVEDVKSFGCHGYVTVPNQNRDKPNGGTYIRLNENDYELVGDALVLSFDPIADRWNY